MNQIEAKRLFEYRGGILYWKVKTCKRIIVGSAAGSSKGVYSRINLNRKVFYSHRIVYLIFNGFIPDQIDHINGDKFDNRIENLRACSSSQNQSNQPLAKNNKSGHKGVHWNRKSRVWRAVVVFNRKAIWVGDFWDAWTANLAVRATRIKLHGEFCNHG